jgi:glutathione S-transferase
MCSGKAKDRLDTQQHRKAQRRHGAYNRRFGPALLPQQDFPMIEVHHLNESRSRRITWLLEELGLDYIVCHYQRDSKTFLAPPELTKIHPLGKAPVIRDGDEVIFESGAIIEYLIRRYGHGRLAPAPDTVAYNRYMQFLQYAEGSAMLPLMLRLYTARLGEGAAPLQPRIDSELQNHLGFLNEELAHRDYFVGNEDVVRHAHGPAVLRQGCVSQPDGFRRADRGTAGLSARDREGGVVERACAAQPISRNRVHVLRAAGVERARANEDGVAMAIEGRERRGFVGTHLRIEDRQVRIAD